MREVFLEVNGQCEGFKFGNTDLKSDGRRQVHLPKTRYAWMNRTDADYNDDDDGDDAQIQLWTGKLYYEIKDFAMNFILDNHS